MNDTELDELLNTWSAPPAPPSLRNRVRAGFVPNPRRKVRWIGSLAAAAVLGCIAFFLVVTQASPQVRTTPIPWTVDSEFVRYAEDGSSSIEMYSTSYESNGNEILLSRSMPDNLFKTAIGRALDAAETVHFSIWLHSTADDERMERMKQQARSHVGFIAGCNMDCLMLEHYFFAKSPSGAGDSCLAGTVVDRETILNYPTAAVRQRWTEHGRMTVSMAPGLGCFALKVTYEDERPDGTFHLVAAKQAIKVNLKP
jgi:hypothetical protein